MRAGRIRGPDTPGIAAGVLLTLHASSNGYATEDIPDQTSWRCCIPKELPNGARNL
jgi:hypothetical protein